MPTLWFDLLKPYLKPWLKPCLSISNLKPGFTLKFKLNLWTIFVLRSHFSTLSVYHFDNVNVSTEHHRSTSNKFTETSTRRLTELTGSTTCFVSKYLARNQIVLHLPCPLNTFRRSVHCLSHLPIFFIQQTSRGHSSKRADLPPQIFCSLKFLLRLFFLLPPPKSWVHLKSSVSQKCYIRWLLTCLTKKND